MKIVIFFILIFLLDGIEFVIVTFVHFVNSTTFALVKKKKKNFIHVNT